MENKWVGLISQGWNDLLNTLFPQLCLVCVEKIVGRHQKVCTSCLADMPFTQHWDRQENEFTERLGIRFPFDYGFALFRVKKDKSVQKLIQLLKYNKRYDIGIWLGKMLAMRIVESGLHSCWDGIVPVPLHSKKERQRGYNQSQAIAKGLSAILSIPVIDDVLQRTRFTVSQTTMNKTQRRSNMRNAFKVNRDTGVALIGKHVLVLDDVLTTGATIESCASELLTIQGLKISVATIGLAEH